MEHIDFASDGSHYVLGATDPSLSLESKGFLWWMLSVGSGRVEITEYAKMLEQLYVSGYLVMSGELELIVHSSPFTRLQSNIDFSAEHPLQCRVLKKGRRKKQVPLGARFFSLFQSVYNENRADNWAECQTQSASRVKVLSAYLKECKARSQGEFLEHGLSIFEKAILHAANDGWWKSKRHGFDVFLKASAGHPFDLAEKYSPKTMTDAEAVASSWLSAKPSSSKAVRLLSC